MTPPDPITLAELIAKDLAGPLGPKIVARVMHKYVGPLDALRSDGHTAERIFERILHLTRETAPNVTLSALRRAVTRARKAQMGASADGPGASAPAPSNPAVRGQATRSGPDEAPDSEGRREQLARLKARAQKFGQPGSH
ncbi:hypothetical protein JKG68_07160 [Microvirga aerilata]|uniref:Uncharacterized protein n=1 Tax=Microvirga aerilata TaxID=670292 RepID=A0A936ZB82_9HYPH|nr:hypothetical protein [Microvirga aerilata]MBL0403737.1 hypothetical protein [Microvirga aerilata]